MRETTVVLSRKSVIDPVVEDIVAEEGVDIVERMNNGRGAKRNQLISIFSCQQLKVGEAIN